MSKIPFVCHSRAKPNGGNKRPNFWGTKSACNSAKSGRFLHLLNSTDETCNLAKPQGRFLQFSQTIMHARRRGTTCRMPSYVLQALIRCELVYLYKTMKND